MEIKTEVIEPGSKELNDEQKKQLAAKIAANYDDWDDDRNEQIDTAREIMREVYLKQPHKKDKNPKLAWKSDVKLNQLYNIKRARKSVMYREMWSNASQMFDVRGTNEQTEKTAKMQKAAIVDSLEKMGIGKQYDNAIDNWFDIGEMIFKTDWIQKRKVVKRQCKDKGFVLLNLIKRAMGAGEEAVELTDIEIPYYENARVESISPLMFVFDAAKYKIKDKDSWDSIIKIYKRFDSIDNIKNNKLYNLTDEQYQELKNSGQDKTEDTKELVDIRDQYEYAGEYAVLFAHGDFKLNGKIYKNYIAEVLAGKYLIRFEENPMYINPFVICATDIDPKTKRGISPLKAVIDMTAEAERLTNVASDVQKLTANPPAFANEDLFDEDNTEKDGTIIYQPGKIIKYKSSYEGNLPNVINVSANGIDTLLGLFDQKISDLSSVSSVMYGNIEKQKRTATELSLADKGSSAQAAKDMDTINQDFTIPMIENVAELLAMFKDGIEYVYAQEKGKNLEFKITNEIRQAQYNYIFEDRNAIAERRSKYQELYSLAQGAGSNPELFKMINWREILVTAFEMIGFDNVEKFFVPQSPATELSNLLNQIPENVQQQIVPQIMQYLQNMQQQMQAQQQQQEMQNRAAQQVQMDMYRQQAKTAMEEQALNSLS
jgi:hypothetical protein|nr:MAG TPA: Head to tail joining protein [Caudoviricetes sp.]